MAKPSTAIQHNRASGEAMSAATDPFYYIKDQIEEAVIKLNSNYGRWQSLPATAPERNKISKGLIEGCGSIQRQVDDLGRAINVAERNPAKFNVQPQEIEQRRKWTNMTKNQVEVLRKTVQTAEAAYAQAQAQAAAAHRKQSRPKPKWERENDDFIQAESDRQGLLMKEQDEDLDDLGQSVERLGDIGLTINEELVQQDRIISELGHEVDSTSNRLDYVQKKLEHVIKKAGSKGQLAMVAALVILLIVLVLLVFYT